MPTSRSHSEEMLVVLFYYLRQEVLRSVVFVCSFVRVLVNTCVRAEYLENGWR